ncbi:transglutaminase family protein [Melioribacteraceae bacterium 4301-Me]|uniref:transglutaminase-like domain-containing protein n=1 Tax=Pyranulibacter aquaticus TaxID=3163344 RepID=UPI003595ACBF
MKKLLFLLICYMTISVAQTKYNNINEAIRNGEFKKAEQLIDSLIYAENLSEEEIYELNFEKEKMERIRKDFTKTLPDILTYVKKYYPNVSDSDIRKWEEDGSLEYKIIDGTKYYFNRAAQNLFRINKDAKKKKKEVDGNQKDKLDVFLESYLPKVVSEANSKNFSLVKPERIKITYRLTVHSDAVPPGEVIRCWLPYPREEHARQTNIKLIQVNSDNYLIAPSKYLQRTIYIEKKAVANKPTIFEYSLEYVGKNQFTKIDVSKIKPYDTSSALYKKYTAERKPHIVFTDKIKNLSREIIGNETNKYLIAKKIYEWINDNIPWAGAREYSTIDNISDYCITNGHGDCGIKTLLFMTLARYNGIPTKWQSGWMLHPDNVNLHDWCEMYLEGYGWLPVDQSFGLKNSDNQDVKWFYFGSTDAYHFIVNDDYSDDLFPAKIYPRSETVDFQRGEVEWKAGNLYFDKWDYNMEVEYLK